MNVFADFHHSDLMLSLQLLFEKRLGWKLYRPIGEEWFTEGYWKLAEPYNNNPATIAQYLDKRGVIPEDGTKPLNTSIIDIDDYYLIDSPTMNQRAITLDRFKRMDIDIVIASIPDHFESFSRLIKDHKRNARLICQFGNILWNIKDYPYKNIMASIAPQKVPSGYNTVFYHQEFDTDVFNYELPKGGRHIRSFVNILETASIYEEDWKTFQEVEKLLPQYAFESYGSSCREGVVNGHKEIAKKMKESLFGFHLKSGGDGFGHILHNWFAVGRPPIVRYSQYEGKLAGELMSDGETCIFVDGLTPEEIANKITHYSSREKHKTLCKNAYKMFKRKVNFDAEFQRIKLFLKNLH